MTTKIMLAQKQGDTAQPLYPKTSTRAVFMEETSGATLRESLLELESASFPDFSGLVTRVETLEKYAPPPMVPGEKTELETESVFVCPTDGMLLLSTRGSACYCQAELLSGEDGSVLQKFGAVSNIGLQDCISVFLPKGSKVRLTFKGGNEASAVFFPLGQ